MTSLGTLLLETGLLQFGRFHEDGVVKPYCLHLDLLPSYPDVLAQITELALPHVGAVDHLLSTGDALPFGVGLSLKTQIPLVYARGTQAATVHELAGAYDIGHPALLLANTSTPQLFNLVRRARVVGLETQAILTIVNEGLYSTTDIPTESLLNLPDMIPELLESGHLPAGQAQMVQHWIKTNRHPGSTAP